MIFYISFCKSSKNSSRFEPLSNREFPWRARAFSEFLITLIDLKESQYVIQLGSHVDRSMKEIFKDSKCKINEKLGKQSRLELSNGSSPRASLENSTSSEKLGSLSRAWTDSSFCLQVRDSSESSISSELSLELLPSSSSRASTEAQFYIIITIIKLL